MFYYKIREKILFSHNKYENLQMITEDYLNEYDDVVYFLTELPIGDSRRSFLISDPSLLFLKSEGLNLLRKPSNKDFGIPNWLTQKIDSNKVCGINTAYNGWKSILYQVQPSLWKINIIGLGDVGGTLLTGLRLLGGNCISEIGIYDLDSTKLSRWFNEVNQILSPDMNDVMPNVKVLREDELFDCDMFVFCVSVGVPPVGKEQTDVRMAQFTGNSKIISVYAKKARESGFKGIFSVVSDPVDLLCSCALSESNKDSFGNYDFKGLAPEQIRGYGLGVMNGRAVFYSNLEEKFSHYKTEGRVFGPHGQGLVVADSVVNYNHNLSLELTQKTVAANLEVRKTGYKPYIAPALSSGSLSLLATIKGEWHYSATFIGGVYMGARNRFTPLGTELERLNIPDSLFNRLHETYENLRMKNGCR